MRGKVPILGAMLVIGRITPAYAGKSYRFFVVACDDRDHPRLCGEKVGFCLLLACQLGSPPPMRGKVYNSSRVEQRNRITPAYAGKRLLQGIGVSGNKDHPRLCGEKH